MRFCLTASVPAIFFEEVSDTPQYVFTKFAATKNRLSAVFLF